MWRSIASALFGGRHDEILPLDEESYEFDLHDVFSSEIGWIPRANRYITQMLMTAVINGSFQKVISAALYLEDQTEEIKKAAFAGGYGPMVWASVLHHYAMLAIYEKNFQRPSSPPTAASSLGSEKIKIPGSVWVPVEIIESYTNQTQFERDLADGFSAAMPTEVCGRR